MSKLRIATGLVLFLFVFTHLTNLAFGLISIEMMETSRVIVMAPWNNPIGGPLLILSFLIHGSLGLWTLYRRNTLLMRGGDAAQALLGVAIVPLLLPHIMGTGIGPAISGAQPNYPWVLAVYWLYAPALGIQQVIALIVVWVHGCYGLFLWMHVQNWWGRLGGLTYPVALIVPVAGLLGFVEAGKSLLSKSANPEFMAPVREVAREYNPIAGDLWTLHDRILIGYAILVGILLVARLIRDRGTRAQVEMAYDDGPVIRRPAGLSMLEMGQREEVPHASLCGGRGRCGSCAVRVLAGTDRLTPPHAHEEATLRRIEAEPSMRLACQAVPTGGSLAIQRVFPPEIQPVGYRELLRDRHAPPSEQAAEPMAEQA
ncbi:MAG: 2Fe-2S iron-sulfur cluster-binding protein [Geminicoccaceae bacterium]